MRKFTLLFALMLLFTSTAMAEAVAELSGKAIASLGTAVSQVQSGQWYVLLNKGRSNRNNQNVYVVKEDGGLKMRTGSPVGTAKFGYLFKIEETGSGTYTIKTYEGESIKLSQNSSTTTTDVVTFNIGNISDNYFYIQQTDNSMLADGQDPGKNFVGWLDNENNPTTPTSTDGNNSYQFIPVTLDNLYQVTYNYKINGKLYTTKVVDVINGNEPSAPAVDFVTVNSLDKTDAVTGDVTINVDCTENLPFQVSTSFADAKWQFIDMHSNDNGTPGIANGTKNYIWTFQAADQDILLPQDDTKQSAKPADTKMWAFVGNLIDGFKIYNKAAGESLTLRKAETGQTAAVMSATDDHNLFKLYKSTEITGATAFKLDGDDYYVNTQAVNSTKVLRGWTAADGGSSCRFFAPAHYMLENIGMDLQTLLDNANDIDNLSKAGALGVPGQDVDIAGLKPYLSVYNPDEINETELMEKVNAIKTAIDATVQVEENKLYRLKNFCRMLPNDNLLDDFNGGYVSYEPTNAANFSCHTRQIDQVGAIFKFEKVDGGYKIYSLNGKGYVGKTNATNASQYVTLTANADEAGIYEIHQLPLGQFNFICTNSGGTISQKYLHASGSGIMNWNDGGASRYFIIPAVEIERSLPEVNGTYYATAYLPFAVSANGEKLYTAQQNAQNANVVDAVETQQIPAEQGFIIEGSAATVTLNILTAEPAAVENNVLTGSLLGQTGINKADYYILGNGDNGLGFYHPNKESLDANKAFIAPQNTQAASLRLNFGGDVTGINGATVNPATENQPIYDLSGRRVEKATKGIYIQGGKKMLVK